VRSLRPEVPPELAALLHRLLAKEPKMRPQSAAEVATAVAAFAGVSLAAEPSPSLPTTKVWPPRKSRWPWLAAATVVLALLGIFLLIISGRTPNPPPSSPPSSEVKPPEPIHVIDLDAKLTRNVKGGGKAAGRLGVDAFDPHFDDTVTLQARLTRPAYSFLIAFHPDGLVKVCFPEKDDERPPLTDRPHYPSTPASAGKEYALNDGVGLEAFAVVVSSKPLPSFKEWWSQCHGCPWKKEEVPPGKMYRANGEDEVEEMDVDGSRGPGVLVPGKTTVAQLAVWLRQTPGIETVQVLGFAVAAKEKP
jgi:hypothetical protein